MLHDAVSCVAAFYFAKRKNWERVEEICSSALVRKPIAPIQIYLLLKLSSAVYVREGSAQAFEILNKTLVQVERLPVLRKGLEKRVMRRFRLRSRKQPRVNWFRVDNIEITVSAGPQGRLHLVGLILDSDLAQRVTSISILIEGIKVGELVFRPIETRGQKTPGGYFEFNLTRSLLSGLGDEGSIAIVVDGSRHELPRRFFGNFWKKREGHDGRTQHLVTEGRILSKGGRLIVPRNRNEEWVRLTFALYTRARQWFRDRLGYDLYLTGGTLLGFARERDVIAFDKDFDSGYLSKHHDTNAIREELRQIIVDLLKAGEDIRLLSGVGAVRRDYFLWHGDKNEHIDVFPGAFVEGRYRRPTFVDTDLTRKDLLPMSIESLCGVEVVVPRDVEKKVEAVYGTTWRRPDPHWKKVRSPAIVDYRHKIMLSREDLSEIAQHSRLEGERLRRALESEEIPTQY
jgi:hypothetical protein